MGHVAQTVQRAGDHQQFAPDAFDTQIGKTVPLNYEGHGTYNCKIVGAEVAEDGSQVTLTVELPDDVQLPGSSSFLSGLSIAD